MKAFKLYEIEFAATGQIDLLSISGNFLEKAEIVYYDQSTSTVKLQLVCELNEIEVRCLCDDFKIAVESTVYNTRLIYKVTKMPL